jgi:molybdate transport system substrate-binding protein
MRTLILTLLLLLPGVARAQHPLTVFAAASLTDAMHDIDSAWQAQHHPALRLSFGSSSTLARQIAEGAPADVFASADEKWMDYLAQRHDLAPGTRRDLLSNKLVLVVPASRPVHLAIDAHLDLQALLGRDGRLAVGDPAHVPAGIYAKQALQKLGLWTEAEKHLAPSADVRAALLLVEQGEAPAGIVYATDAAISPKVMVAGVFPADSHPPISYPFAAVKSADTPDARALLAFLDTPLARAIFAKRGFGAE